MTNVRGNWSNRFEFLFSVIGCMVGLGNVWRFPYICFQSGGAAFLIPYFLAMFVCAMPAFLIELSFCQYSNLGPGRVWIVCPLFQGIGYGMVVLTGIVSIYYNVILAWTLYYLAGSFSSVLPWSTCTNQWNTEHCLATDSQSSLNSSIYNSTLTEPYSSDVDLLGNMTFPMTSVALLSNKTVTPSEEYWRLHVLEMSPGIEYPGTVRWQLLLCLLGAWIAVLLSLCKGIKSAGKVLYVAATAPYLILLALLIRGALLPGAIDGIKYYIIPHWEKLLDPQVWRNAAAQVFYSIGLGIGGLSTLASYNSFHNNCHRDAIMFPILNCFTSLFAGFIIFTYLGYMANRSGVPIQNVVNEGPGLAFMTYPDAVATMPLPQLWSVLFFLMLFTVGMDSQIVHVQTIVTALTDAFPRKLGKRKLLLTICVCTVGFVLGISCITQGGIYVLTLMDWYVGSMSVMTLAVLEMMVLAWIYGVNRLYEDIQMMIGFRISPIWKVMWLAITPIFVTTLLVMGLIHFTPVKVGGKSYPAWASVVGWFVATMPLLPTPIGMVAAVWTEPGHSLKEKIINSTKPRKEWQPAINKEQDEHIPLEKTSKFDSDQKEELFNDTM